MHRTWNFYSYFGTSGPSWRAACTHPGPAHLSCRALRAVGGLRDLEALRAVFVAREGRLLGALAAKMAGAKGGEAVFEVWMKRESDLVQVGSGSSGGRGMRVKSTGSKGKGQ